ncbi:MAG: hypothetical protein R3B06_18565 [Kofleriaceae bacterium]
MKEFIGAALVLILATTGSAGGDGYAPEVIPRSSGRALEVWGDVGRTSPAGGTAVGSSLGGAVGYRSQRGPWSRAVSVGVAYGKAGDTAGVDAALVGSIGRWLGPADGVLRGVLWLDGAAPVLDGQPQATAVGRGAYLPPTSGAPALGLRSGVRVDAGTLLGYAEVGATARFGRSDHGSSASASLWFSAAGRGWLTRWLGVEAYVHGRVIPGFVRADEGVAVGGGVVIGTRTGVVTFHVEGRLDTCDPSVPQDDPRSCLRAVVGYAHEL